MKLIVLMSTYNGGNYLEEQLESILKQKIDEQISVDILVRDDGSIDNTKTILNKYKKKGVLDWYEGENMKPAKSFWNLVCNAPQADYYAFCDQDDVWFEDKLQRAVSSICNKQLPMLYCSTVISTDVELKPLRKQMKTMQFVDFPHSLLYSLAPGCTFVFNEYARKELIAYDMSKEVEVIHDWLAHKIIALKGEVVFDKEPSMYYRQHGNNVIGCQSGVRGFLDKVKRFCSDKTCIRSNVAKAILNVYGKDIKSDTDEYRCLNMIANYKNSRKLMKMFLNERKFRTRTVNDVYMKLLIIWGKI